MSDLVFTHIGHTLKPDLNQFTSGKVIIGIYHADGTLIGYKADTWWNLVRDKNRSKLHSLDENGEVPSHLLNNLSMIVTRQHGPFESLTTGIVKVINENSGLKVGYELEDSIEPIFTHTIVTEGLEEIF